MTSGMRPSAPVAVTGMGTVSAAGASLAESLRALENGRTGTSPPPFATAYPFPVFLCPLATDTLLSTHARYSRTVGLALRAAREALALARLDGASPPGLRIGIVVGTSVGVSLEFYSAYAAGQIPPLGAIDHFLVSNPSLALSEILHFRGPSQTVVNACSSGADAIGLGAAWIRTGVCDVVLAGGADELSRTTYAGFSSLRLPSREACMPFDSKRSGLSLGEGAAFMVLESEASRRSRGARAHAFVAGYGTATDAYHLTAPHPEGRGLVEAARQAFEQAGASWEQVAFINAHGTATQANDAAEAAFFRAHCPGVPFIATKGSTGHTLGAAGAIEAVFTAAHLNERMLPPSPGFRELDPALGVAPVSTATSVHGDLALSQSLAFGGNNSILLLARGEQ